MTNVSVHEYVDSAINSPGLERAQIQSAGTIIAQFLQVKKGLEGRVSSDVLDVTAATLTAAIWARTDSN
ncbi:hypothetical protein [Massilia haematophila]|uniref:Uncharacterized protein n=1 Tax=Massilia haematophila TaxID=457923 RepID=A0ABV7PN95_9BURK